MNRVGVLLFLTLVMLCLLYSVIIVTIGVGSQFAARGDIGLYKDKPDQDVDFISSKNNALI